VAARTISHEERLALLCLLTIDLSEHLFRPAWGRQACQLLFDAMKFVNGGRRLEQSLFGSFGDQIDGQKNAHRFSKIAADGI
jgi:hypothetical protein